MTPEQSERFVDFLLPSGDLKNREELRELRQELMDDERKESYCIWLSNNKTELEAEFINSFPTEDIPNDDDTPDFISNHIDEFEEWTDMIYMTEVNE